jgi:hypothetical protein
MVGGLVPLKGTNFKPFSSSLTASEAPRNIRALVQEDDSALLMLPATGGFQAKPGDKALRASFPRVTLCLRVTNMGEILTEFIIIFLLLVANGVFAMTEIAVVSARKAPGGHRPVYGTPGEQAGGAGRSSG